MQALALSDRLHAGHSVPPSPFSLAFLAPFSLPFSLTGFCREKKNADAPPCLTKAWEEQFAHAQYRDLSGQKQARCVTAM